MEAAGCVMAHAGLWGWCFEGRGGTWRGRGGRLCASSPAHAAPAHCQSPPKWRPEHLDRDCG